ncbi:putative P-loop containing nucleoside triphosphate hydrolase, leucine-rich repeat domain, L [Rosa chinensis]|uniref:Putative P-loop containing nucleoside triphosphate hydrolase, leucine-rich repeat domain, L n=2 Tax=Rosa chinensis TaxID=74649 RepID=A0A2P6RR80_ROSCH|nr:putative P-loop containing nucleoside triphosphate hydrolase, leucine-rich repeat domain, L [Rosa chinensis]
MGHKVKEMRKRLVEINNEKREFALFEFLKIAEDPSVLRGMHDNKRETDSLVEASDVIGRDDDKKQIISHLLNNTDISNEENVSVISILGLGGLGKTTLAKLVYNDSMVEENFDMKMWVCVSDNFDIQTLICGIINAVIEQKCEDASLDLMKRRLQDNLRGRKFFLVLDDIWDTESIGVTIEKWICLKNMLNVGANGSKIIITTRHGSVASLMSPVHVHSLKGLSDRDCMSLFIKRAFKRGEEQRYQHLIEIGNDIVKKCGGVPLAVATVGSMLYLKTDKHQWLSVRDDDMWSIRNDNILPALKLSYDALPQHMKPCFAFCSLFPKDYVFNSGLLVPLWIAQGYLMTSKKNEDLEHMGEDYIRQFCSRSLFQVEIDLKTAIVFKIHDLVHDLAISVAQVEYSTVNFRPSSAFEMVRHVSISKIDLLGKETQLPDFMLKSIKLRTILISRADCQMNQRFVKACISRFKCVRVLDLSGWPLEELPSSIDSLFHLRFLNLSDSRKIKRLPNSISKLLNLETLCLIGCDALEEIPKDIGNLINLRYLVITTQQAYLPKGIRRLTLLQTLAFDGCVNLKSLGEEIQFLNNLRKLWIGSCNNLESLPPNMKHMTALHTLFIVNCEKLQVMMRSGEAPQGLRSLIIENSSLEALPPWLIEDSADTLQSIWLGECHNLTALPELIKFTFLEQLHIVECSKLSALPQGLHCLTELRELYIEGCPELSKSCKRQLKGEEWSKMARQVKITLDADDEEDEADNRLADSRISYQYPCGGRRGLLATRCCSLWRGS